jgi:hypothetical protein
VPVSTADLYRSRIAEVAQEMGGIIAVRRNLAFDMVSPVARRRCYPLALRPIGTISQQIGDDLEPTRVAKPTEHERCVSS